MKEQNLFAGSPEPPRLPKVDIPREARQEIIDYFAVLATQHGEFSYEGSRIETILGALEERDEPIEDLLETARRQCPPGKRDDLGLYQVALEMLYAVRHRLEAEFIRGQLPAS